MTEKYVIVHRTFDPVHADLLGDILRENGILARVLGTRHGAVIGVGQGILQMHIEVPQSQAGEATDFIEAFLSGDGEALLEEHLEAGDHGDAVEEEDDHAAADRGSSGDVLSPLFAAGAALVLSVLGGGHLYGRQPFTAALLAVGQFVALSNIASLQWRTVSLGIIMLILLTVFDLLGGQIAVRDYNRGARKAPLRQLATGALLLALAGSLAAFLSHRWPEPKRGSATGPAPAVPKSFSY